MTIVPFRGIGSEGLVTDLLPYELPTTAWTYATNVRFKDNYIAPYASFKELGQPANLTSDPLYLFDETGNGDVIAYERDGTIHLWPEGGTGPQQDLSPSSAMDSSNEDVTVAELGGVTYINSGGNLPLYRRKDFGDPFEVIPAWDSNDRCRVFKTFKDFALALNVRKGADEYPLMVKWSDATQYGSPPPNWDVNDDASLAGETILNDATGPIRDAVPLGNSMAIYTTREIYRMDYVGEPFVFAFDKINDEGGVISTNCVVSVNQIHYFMGNDDIRAFDGNSWKSLIDGRVRRRIFNYLDKTDTTRFFAFHDSMNSEIVFAYRTTWRQGDWNTDYVEGCNEAAVYNYQNDTWSFVELPGVSAITETIRRKRSDWGAFSQTWDAGQESWSSVEETGKNVILSACMTNDRVNFDKNLLYIDETASALVDTPTVPNLRGDPTIERVYNDMDQLFPDIIGYKTIRSVIPQVIPRSQNGYLAISIGASDYPSSDIKWEEARIFDPRMDVKHDTRIAGRYLSLRIRFVDDEYSELSSMNFDVKRLAMR